MADLTRTPRNIALVTETKPHLRFYRANVAIEPGQPCYLMTNGRIAPTSAAVAGTTAPFVGFANGEADAGQTVSILWDGSIYGFDLSDLDYSAKVYLSDTPGEISDTPGTVSVPVGAVLPLSDRAATKVLYIQARLVPQPE